MLKTEKNHKLGDIISPGIRSNLDKFKYFLIAIFFISISHPLHAGEIVRQEGLAKTIRGDFVGDSKEDIASLKVLQTTPAILFYQEYDLEVQAKNKTYTTCEVYLLSENSSGLEKVSVSPKKKDMIGVSYAAGLDVWRLIIYASTGRN